MEISYLAKHRYAFPILLFLIGILWHNSPTLAQGIGTSQCKLLQTQFHWLVSTPRWQSPDKVTFGVASGLPRGAINDTSTHWYQYQPSTDRLQKLDASPYDASSVSPEKAATLNGLATEKPDVYERLRISPSGDKFIYPRMNGNRETYW